MRGDGQGHSRGGDPEAERGEESGDCQAKREDGSAPLHDRQAALRGHVLRASGASEKA